MPVDLLDHALGSAGVALRDVQDAASHSDPRTTVRYDRARHSLDRHAKGGRSRFVDVNRSRCPASLGSDDFILLVHHWAHTERVIRLIDWTVDVLAARKPEWAERNIFGPLDNRRDANTIGNRAPVIAETASCGLTTLSMKKSRKNGSYTRSSPISLLRSTRVVAAHRSTRIIEQPLEAEPWIIETGGAAIIDLITNVLMDHESTAA